MIEKMKVKLDLGAFMPKYAHDADAGMDFFSREDVVIPPESDHFFDTGVHMEIPVGYYGKMDSKSGLNRKHKIVVEAGVIDAEYTGSIGVTLRNNSQFEFVVGVGDKIAQMIILPCEHPELVQVDDLEETERGNGGFGSTGR